MPSIKQIQRRIKSVQTTAKITAAMQAVAAMRLRKYSRKAEMINAYGQNLRTALYELFTLGHSLNNLELAKTRRHGKTIMVIVAPSRGFCGGLHRTVITHAYNYLKDIGLDPTNPEEVEIITVHRPAYRLVTKLGGKILAYFNGPFKNLDPYQILPISELLYRIWSNKNASVKQILVSYAQPQSNLKAKLVVDQVLPLSKFIEDETKQEIKVQENSAPTTIEIDPNKFIEDFLPQWLEMSIHLAILDTMAAEEGARMMAMNQASDNAKRLGEKLRLVYFRQRQAKITQEISEIVGGSMAN
ncbi:MAG: F0F1 ATP synthase subunit gamma [Patescibacteria group bacterium]